MYYSNYEIEMMHKAKRDDQLRESLIYSIIIDSGKKNKNSKSIISSIYSFFVAKISLTNLFSNIKMNILKFRLTKN